MIRFLRMNFFLAFNQKDKQAPSNLSSCLTVYLVHYFFFFFWKASPLCQLSFFFKILELDITYPNMAVQNFLQQTLIKD